MSLSPGNGQTTSSIFQVQVNASYETPFRWVILALLWLLYFSFGVVTRSISPLITPIINDLNMTYSQMGFVLGSWQMTYIMLAIMSGIIIDRWGIRKSIFWGTLIMGLSAFLRAFSIGFLTLLIFVALFGVGGPMISIGCPKTIARWFKGKGRSLAVGVYATGPWIGGMATLAATNRVVMPLVDYSWRWCFIYYGVMTFIFACIWWFFTKDVQSEIESERINPIRVLGNLLKVASVRTILICGTMAFGISHGYFSWLPKILEAKGFTPVNAGLASAVPIIASIPAVLAIPRSVPVHLRGKVIAVFALVAGTSILWVVATPWPPIPGLLLFGATCTCLFPLLVLTLMEIPEVALKYLGSATGVFFCVSEIGGFFGPFIVGYLVDLSGMFLIGALFLSTLSVIIFSLTFFLNTGPTSSGEIS